MTHGDVAAVGSAFVALAGEARRDGARRLGRTRPVQGPLAGVTVAVKDNVDVAGLPTRAGSSLLGRMPAAADAPVVAALRSAGAVVIGKTRMSEFAADAVCLGCTHPLQPERISGGSSGGSAVAVANGVDVGVGTDTAGSVRIPAALCGLAGIRLRRDRIAVRGTVPVAPSFDSYGFITQSLAGLARLWSSLTGAAVVPGRVTVGFPDGTFLTTAEAAVAGVFEDAIRRLATITRAVAVPLSDPAGWETERFFPVATEMLSVHRRAGLFPQRADGYGAPVRRQLEFAERLTPADRDRAAGVVERIRAEHERALDVADVLVVPTTPMTAPLRTDVTGAELSVTRTLTRFTAAANLCDLAAVTIPAGVDGRGLPIGLQFVARDEPTALRGAHLFERT